MQMTCPDCGFQGDLVAFLVEGEARQMLMLLVHPDLPARMPPLLVRYIGLFKESETRAVSWPRAHQLLRDLIPRIKEAPAVVWVRALEQCLLNAVQGKLRTPLRDHQYLFGVLLNMAREFGQQRASDQERKREQLLREGKRSDVASESVLSEINERAAKIQEQQDAIDGWQTQLKVAENRGITQVAETARAAIATHRQKLEALQS